MHVRGCEQTRSAAHPSLLSQWFVTYFVVGRTPSSAPDPWSGFSNTLKAKADEGVGRGLCAEQPGGPPHFAQIFNKLLGHETSIRSRLLPVSHDFCAGTIANTARTSARATLL